MKFTVTQDANPDFEIRTYENGKVWRTKKWEAIMRDTESFQFMAKMKAIDKQMHRDGTLTD